MSEPEIGGGRVEIALVGGKACYLEPSLEACIEVSRMAGGLMGALERCQRMHFETICGIVGIGVVIDGNRLNPGQREKMLPKAIYEAGIVGVSAACQEFVGVLGNGGRSLADLDEEDAGEASDEAPLA